MEPQTGLTGLTNELSGWIRGENKPRVIIDVDYLTIIYIMVAMIFVSVISALIVNSFTK